MTATQNARATGAAYLVYIAAGVTLMAWTSAPRVITVVFGLVESLSASTLAVTLYALTRQQDREIAMMGMMARVAECVLGALSNALLSATFFAVGSTLFCWLLLRGRIIPAGLAWLGLVASILLVVVLPLQIAGIATGTITQVVWLPMAAFEIPVAIWFLVKGAKVQ